MTTTQTWIAGTWDADPAHSQVAFSVRHMMVGKVRGRFNTFTAEIVTGSDPGSSSVTAVVDAASVDTGNDKRDAHVRSPEFLDVARHPTWTFRSTAVRATDDDGLQLDGDLTIAGVTRAVTLDLEVDGFGPDTSGGTRCGFSATGAISRSDFGVDIVLPLDSGGVMVGETVRIDLEVEAVLRP